MNLDLQTFQSTLKSALSGPAGDVVRAIFPQADLMARLSPDLWSVFAAAVNTGGGSGSGDGVSLQTITGFASTSLTAAQQNLLVSSQAQCARLNANLIGLYQSKFNDWKVSVDAGKIDNSNPPKPPASYVVISVPDPANESILWSSYEQSGPPVCDIPAIPEDHSKSADQIRAEAPAGTFDLGPSSDGGAGVWFAAGPRDNMKNGAIVETPDGKFQKVPSPVGHGWWKKIG